MFGIAAERIILIEVALLVATASALNFTGGAEWQLTEMPRHSPVNDGCVVLPRADCRTSVEGKSCYKIVLAMQTGLVQNTSFEEALNEVKRKAQELDAPTAEDKAEQRAAEEGAGWKAREEAPHKAKEEAERTARDAEEKSAEEALQAPEECHTSVKGEACYQSVVLAMRTCKLAKSACYFPLTKHSSFEDFQRLLRSTAQSSHVCPEPCAVRAL